MPVSNITTTSIGRPLHSLSARLFFYLSIRLFSRWPPVIVFMDAGTYLRSENVTYAILTERRVNIHRSATLDEGELIWISRIGMRAMALGSRWPSSVNGRGTKGGRESEGVTGSWWLEIGPGSRSNGCRACKHPSNDWPNRNLHNTWRSAARLLPSAALRREERPSVSVKPPNFLGLGSGQEFPVVIELSVSSVRDSTCWLAKLCKAACRTPDRPCRRYCLSTAAHADMHWRA